MELLLTAKAQVDRVDNGSRTPTHCAAENGHLAVVATLLGANASAGDVTSNGETPAFLAAAKGFDAAVQALLYASISNEAALKLLMMCLRACGCDVPPSLEGGAGANSRVAMLHIDLLAIVLSFLPFAGAADAINRAPLSMRGRMVPTKLRGRLPDS